jgi:ribosome biogenesis GTPase A
LINFIKAFQLPNKKNYIGIVAYPNTWKSCLIKALKYKYASTARSTIIQGTTEIIIDNNYRIFSTPAVIFSKTEIGPHMPKTTKDVESLKTPLDTVKIIIETIPHDNIKV